MVQVQDDNYVQPDLTITTFPPTEHYYKAKPKRTRKPWVYKEKYDKLDRKYRIVKRIALLLLIAFAIALRF